MAIDPKHRWLQGMSAEDFAFIKRFVLASGSLKALAEEYQVSYPTIRLRLDRLIQKIQVLEDAETPTEFERTLRALYADGRVDMETMTVILDAHKRKEEKA